MREGGDTRGERAFNVQVFEAVLLDRTQRKIENKSKENEFEKREREMSTQWGGREISIEI